MAVLPRMARLAREITCHLVSEYGPDEVLRRLSDPYWFQAFGCVLGFDWHSSGVTTTTTGAIKEGIKGLERDLGFWAAGGKGQTSQRTPVRLRPRANTSVVNQKPSSTPAACQPRWTVLPCRTAISCTIMSSFLRRAACGVSYSKGMNEEQRTARRYHWLGERLVNFVCEPHAAVCCDIQSATLNLVALESDGVRVASAELASHPYEVLKVIRRLPELTMPSRHQVSLADVNLRFASRNLLKTYEHAPKDFESLLGIAGVGPRTLRALALASELIYGTPASTRDPARFSFVHGGKDGTPFPVDRSTYEQTITVLHAALNRAQVDRSEKVRALKRLAQLEQKHSAIE